MGGDGDGDGWRLRVKEERREMEIVGQVGFVLNKGLSEGQIKVDIL